MAISFVSTDEASIPSVAQDRFNALLRHHQFTVSSTEDLRVFRDIYEKHRDVLGFNQQGREVVDALIRKIANKKKDIVVILEIGVWLGQSLERWLSVSQKVRVIGVDPFLGPNSNHSKVTELPEEIRSRFGTPSFNRALTEYVISQKIPDASSRTLLLTGFYPKAAAPLFEKEGPDVDIFYLDGGKSENVDAHMQFVNSTLRGILERFPSIVVAGDDWSHGSHAPEFQALVHGIAKAYGRSIHVKKGRTWIMR